MSYIAEKNNITNDIKQVQSLIKRSEDTIKRLKQQEKSDFNVSQINKLEVSIVEYVKRVDDLNSTYDKICKGEYIPENKPIIIVTKKPEIKEKKKEVTQVFQYDNRDFSAKFLQKQTDRFIDSCNNIPDYMIDNIRNMPINRGYIWKGIACYGDKPSEGNISTLFEKRNGIMKIHEWSKSSYCMYEKIDRGQKNLIFQRNRTSCRI